MTKTARARYTLEFKQEAVRLVEGGQSIAAAARTLGVVDQTLFNWVKAQRQGQLKGADSKAKVSAEQMEISRLPCVNWNTQQGMRSSRARSLTKKPAAPNMQVWREMSLSMPKKSDSGRKTKKPRNETAAR